MVPLSIILRQAVYIDGLYTVSLLSMGISIFYLIIKAAENIRDPTYAKSYNKFDLNGVPYFFGISCFAFEGNLTTIEIYKKLDNKKLFSKALGSALLLVTFMFQFTGIFIYWAFAQYTQPHIFDNLPPNSYYTLLVRLIYGLALTTGYLLILAPMVRLFDKLERVSE
jgi:amino acid permease